MKPTRQGVVLFLLMLLGGIVFTLGITWGLPSRQDDRYLLGADYRGLRLERLTAEVPEVDAGRGADVVTPSGDPNALVPLNDTDEKRAQILCRYRLYSYQPDEMITFRALSVMKPRSGDFDPRLYQYGGLWIYPVGALIEAGGLAGVLKIADRATYIGNPELFGRFYVVARAYSAAWGVVGVWAVFMLARRWGGGSGFVAACGAICFIFMPVVINAAHEAKPHLAGTVLILLAVLAADHWVQSGRTRWAWMTGVLCGAAAGMVLWGVLAVLVIAAMALLRRDKLVAIVAALFGMVGVYAITNPYVMMHLVHGSAALESNLGNTAGMYHYSLRGLGTAWDLMAAGMGNEIVLGLFAGICLVAVARRSFRRRWWVLGAVAGVNLLQFAMTAAGKTGEYARFAMAPDLSLIVFVMAILGSVRSGAWLAGAMTLLVICGGGVHYLVGYMRDAANSTSRRVAAAELENMLESKRRVYDRMTSEGKGAPRRPVLGVFSDPAPYCLPPVDLSGWDIVRLPRGYDPARGGAADVIVRPVESDHANDADLTPISWADKQFDVIQNVVDENVAKMVR
jgi:hypothetical protein